MSFEKLIEYATLDGIIQPIKIINNLNPSHLIELLNIKPIKIEKKYCDNNNDNDKYYERILIHKSNSLSIFLLKWQPNAETIIHNHNFNNKECFCYFYILKGNFKEILYHIDKENFYSSNNSSFINDKNYTHKLINLDNDISYSLHIYPN